MGRRLGIGGLPNSGKSFGRRYIPDGENVMILAPSIKTTHLYSGPKNAASLSRLEIDDAIEEGTRTIVKPFDLKSPTGGYASLQEGLLKIPKGENRSLQYLLGAIMEKKDLAFYGGPVDARKFITGNMILCEKLTDLKLYMAFVNDFMPWIHTIILPDFTHFITETLTSEEFRNRKAKDEAFARYIDLAAESLRSFIKSADSLRPELIVITEYHVEYMVEESKYVIFTPGGRLLTEKFLPGSYYDTFLFTDVKYHEDEEAIPDYRFVTRKIPKYPEARAATTFKDLYMPNDLQEVLTNFRRAEGIPIPELVSVKTKKTTTVAE